MTKSLTTQTKSKVEDDHVDICRYLSLSELFHSVPTHTVY